MRLVDFLKENVINGENLLIYVKLDVGTKESYEKGCRFYSTGSGTVS